MGNLDRLSARSFMKALSFGALFVAASVQQCALIQTEPHKATQGVFPPLQAYGNDDVIPTITLSDGTVLPASEFSELQTNPVDHTLSPILSPPHVGTFRTLHKSLYLSTDLPGEGARANTLATVPDPLPLYVRPPPAARQKPRPIVNATKAKQPPTKATTAGGGVPAPMWMPPIPGSPKVDTAPCREYTDGSRKQVPIESVRSRTLPAAAAKNSFAQHTGEVRKALSVEMRQSMEPPIAPTSATTRKHTVGRAELESKQAPQCGGKTCNTISGKCPACCVDCGVPSRPDCNSACHYCAWC